MFKIEEFFLKVLTITLLSKKILDLYTKVVYNYNKRKPELTWVIKNSPSQTGWPNFISVRHNNCGTNFTRRWSVSGVAVRTSDPPRRDRKGSSRIVAPRLDFDLTCGRIISRRFGATVHYVFVAWNTSRRNVSRVPLIG